MKIFLSQKGFSSLIRLAKEAGTTPSEVVEHLVLAFERVPIDERDTPQHICAFCNGNIKYFSEESLKWHLKRKHSDKTVVKN